MNKKPRKFTIAKDKGVIAYRISFTYIKPECTKVHIYVDVKHGVNNDHFTLKGEDYNLYFKSGFKNTGNNIQAGVYEFRGTISINLNGYKTKDLSEFKQVRLNLTLLNKNIKCRAIFKPKVYISRQIHDKVFQDYNKNDIQHKVNQEKDIYEKYTPYEKTNIKKPFQGGGCCPK